VLDELERRRERYQENPNSLSDWKDVKHRVAEERAKEN
jgi:hypothetical protein